MTRLEDLFGEVISSYSREQALRDGVLVDVSEHAREVGFRFPVALTAAVAAELAASSEAEAIGQSFRGRLHDLLSLLSLAIRRARHTSEVSCRLRIAEPTEGGGVSDRELVVRCVCGPGDDGEPVLTVLLPSED